MVNLPRGRGVGWVIPEIQLAELAMSWLRGAIVSHLRAFNRHQNATAATMTTFGWQLGTHKRYPRAFSSRQRRVTAASSKKVVAVSLRRL